MVKLNAQELRTTEPSPEDIAAIPKNDITIIVDNVLDTYNIGSIFRLADAVAARRVYLCGETLVPPNSRIKKASVSTWKWVAWEHRESAVEAITELRHVQPEITVVSVEQHPQSVPFQQATFTLPLAVIVGHESDGVSTAALEASDQIVELPMWGVNRSLNVMVSLGIVLYEAVRQTEMSHAR